jgi:hypothetical protein
MKSNIVRVIHPANSVVIATNMHSYHDNSSSQACMLPPKYQNPNVSHKILTALRSDDFTISMYGNQYRKNIYINI